MPGKSSNEKNEKQHEALRMKGRSKDRAAGIANSSEASSRGGKSARAGGKSSSKQGGTTAQEAAGQKGGQEDRAGAPLAEPSRRSPGSTRRSGARAAP